MSEIKKPEKLSLKKTVTLGAVEQSFSHGRKKTVQVEVRKKRSFHRVDGQMVADKPVEESQHEVAHQALFKEEMSEHHLGGLTGEERQSRLRALQQAETVRAEELQAAKIIEQQIAEEQAKQEVVQQKLSEQGSEEAAATKEEQAKANHTQGDAAATSQSKEQKAQKDPKEEDAFVKAIKGNNRLALTDFPDERVEEQDRSAKGKTKSLAGKKRGDDSRKKNAKLTVTKALEHQGERMRSLASLKRARAKLKRHDQHAEVEKFVREVIVPEVITVQELASRMAERGTDVVRELMKMGMMVKANDTIDADTAELIVAEFGHKIKRVTEADVENVLLADDQDDPEKMQPRAPVVTIMGHVDHGKTSLLDALRSTDVAAGEAGGITQHIGAYRVTLENKKHITFLDTPGHAAFTEMRMRGAKATDIVVLVVAADDGIMEQTIEAINHAKAAEVPIIVAINKIDKPDANPQRVLNELLQHSLVPESMGGDIMTVEVSAKERLGLDTLEETILLQAEVLELEANPDCRPKGIVIEAKIDKGKGVIATFLVQKGSLKIGDLVIAGTSVGRVRAMIDDKGRNMSVAAPSMPVEVWGLDEVPEAGDPFAVVETERQAREISEYRKKLQRDLKVASENKDSLEHLFSKAAGSGIKELPIIIKADVHGSAEAIVGSLVKLGTDEVAVKVLHSAVGAITESDISLAKASHALILGFNVRANAQAKELAERDKLDIRYYSIIYNLVDDMKVMLGGMLAPALREKYLGTADIRQIFNMSKYGKVAGCFVTDGIIKRGAGVRLLRDNIVIHEGKLKTLKRFKDDVKEVNSNFECGMAFENYEDIKEGDKIEAFEVIEEERTL